MFWQVTQFFRPYAYRSQWVNCTLHQIEDGEDTNSQTGVITHPSISPTQSQGNTGSDQGMNEVIYYECAVLDIYQYHIVF